MTRYDASSVQMLEGLEGIRHRPAMYIGGTGKDGLHHLVWEVVDNSVDEAIGGHCTTIQVNLSEDGKSISVTDNGRGIPVDIHPKHKVSALELILCNLHTGGKFDSKAYNTSGGLHGVGTKAVNALSTSMTAEVKRDGKLHRQRYRRGKPRGPVTEVGPARGTGTTISFTPDPEIFGDVRFDPELIRERLEVKSYLNKGLRIIFACLLYTSDAADE